MKRDVKRSNRAREQKREAEHSVMAVSADVVLVASEGGLCSLPVGCMFSQRFNPRVQVIPAADCLLLAGLGSEARWCYPLFLYLWELLPCPWAAYNTIAICACAHALPLRAT